MLGTYPCGLFSDALIKATIIRRRRTMEKRGRVLTSIGTRHNDNLPREVWDIVNIELALRREGFVNDGEYNTHGGLFCEEGVSCFNDLTSEILLHE
jgi:hypothetical protein